MERWQVTRLLPRKRVILAVHRWLGASAALFLVVLAVTGLLLNHSKALGLDRIQVNASLVRSLYGMAKTSDILTYRIHDSDTVSLLQGRLYFNGQYLSLGESLVGIHESESISVIATPDALVLITREGELIEITDTSRLPFDSISALGVNSSGLPIIVSSKGAWQADQDWIQFQAFEGDYGVRSPDSASLPDTFAGLILSDYQGSGPALSKVILDLHSGRLFGWGGRTVMDLTAVAILLLVTSGLSGWVRKSRWSLGK